MKKEDIDKLADLMEISEERIQDILDTFYPQMAIYGTIIGINKKDLTVEFDGTWIIPMKFLPGVDLEHGRAYFGPDQQDVIEFSCVVPYDFFIMDLEELQKQDKSKMKIELYNDTNIPDEEFFKREEDKKLN